MDDSSAPIEHDEATPIFGAYRRGYDPEQVDRFVADQRRRLDETTHRASEAERKLAAAVGQLRELHRRVAVLESDERSPQPASIDTLGERVQRVLQEAWEGAYAVRQSAEQEASEALALASTKAEEVVAAAERKAEAVQRESEARRQAFMDRIDQERARAVAQMTYLSDQRKLALGELVRLRDLIDATVTEVSGEPTRAKPPASSEREPAGADTEQPRPMEPRVAADPDAAPATKRADDDLPRTLPVYRLAIAEAEHPVADTAALVRTYRASVASDDAARMEPTSSEHAAPFHPTVFDFEAQQSRRARN